MFVSHSVSHSKNHRKSHQPQDKLGRFCTKPFYCGPNILNDPTKIGVAQSSL